jgi:NADH-quinone oxidoreductase subunit L
MVTAGVFMVCRLSPMFELRRPRWHRHLSSARRPRFFAATVGLVQNDIKRVIAYSTCSQLGYMFFARASAPIQRGDVPPVHARLLQGAAVPRRGLGDPRDAPRAGHALHGRLRKPIPITWAMMTIGTLRADRLRHPGHLAASPASIRRTRSSKRLCGQAASGAFRLLVRRDAALLTSFYSWRLVFMTFFGAAALGGQRAYPARGSRRARP